MDYEKGEARLYPASTSADADSVDTTGDNNLRLMVEVPLLRTEAGGDAIRLVELDGLHVGAASEEVWLLVVPANMRGRSVTRLSADPGIRTLTAAGDLRESVVLSCTSWCQLQRAPLGKLLNLLIHYL